MTTAPNTGLTFQNANSLRTDELYAELINYLDAWLNCGVLAVGQAAPTGTEVDGDRYIIGTGTGPFVGHDGKLAIKFSGTWFFFAPPAAGIPIVKNLSDGTDWECVAGVWTEKASGGASAYDALSDVDTTGLADGDMMVWDAGTSMWRPIAPGAGGGASDLADLSDVDVTGIADGDILIWDASTSTWLPGVGGGGGGGGMVLLGTAVATGGATAALGVTGIPAGYSALKLVYSGRSTKASTTDDLRITFNGDTGANYNTQLSSFIGAGGYFSSTVNAAAGDIGFVPGASAPANSLSTLEMIIPRYDSATFDKSSVATYALDFGTTSGGVRNVFWHPTTPVAITSLSLIAAGGNHVDGSILYVYGLPATVGGGGGDGPLEKLLDFTVTTAVQDIDFTGLDLDADETYIIELSYVPASTGDKGIYLYFNNDLTATNYNAVLFYSDGASPSGFALNSAYAFSVGAGSIYTAKAKFEIGKLAGHMPRTAVTATGRSAAGLRSMLNNHEWTGTGNVTDIKLRHADAAGFAVGTRARLYKLS